MAETLMTTHSGGKHLMDLAITLNGTQVSVASGSITFEEVQESFPGDSFNITQRAYDCEYRGYLVRQISGDNSVALFVDEVVDDGVDDGYPFDHDPDYLLLAYLFQFTLPASQSDLTGVDHIRWRILGDA